MAITQVNRRFVYNNIQLDDPNPEWTVDQVLEFYSEAYPKLAQGVVDGPEFIDDAMQYDLVEKVGSKGTRISIEDIAKCGFFTDNQSKLKINKGKHNNTNLAQELTKCLTAAGENKQVSKLSSIITSSNNESTHFGAYTPTDAAPLPVSLLTIA